MQILCSYITKRRFIKKSGAYFKNLVFRPFKQGFDSLELGFGYLQTYLGIPVTDVGYKELQGGGLKYISNLELRESIIKHYSVKNWEYNRPPDMARCPDIARYIYNSKK